MKKELLKSLALWAKAFGPSILWAIFIFLLSSQTTLPGLAVSWSDYAFKKLAHIFVYAVLFLLLHWGIQQTVPQKKHGPFQIWQIAFFITFLYALSDEFHQSFVPGRYGTFRDLGYDLLGAFIAFLKRYNYI